MQVIVGWRVYIVVVVAVLFCSVKICADAILKGLGHYLVHVLFLIIRIRLVCILSLLLLSSIAFKRKMSLPHMRRLLNSLLKYFIPFPISSNHYTSKWIPRRVQIKYLNDGIFHTSAYFCWIYNTTFNFFKDEQNKYIWPTLRSFIHTHLDNECYEFEQIV